MRKMIAIVILLGLAVSAWILRREIRRAPEVPNAPKAELGAVDRWQRSIRLSPPSGYATERDRALLEKLRREEERQRPQEGRN